MSNRIRVAAVADIPPGTAKEVFAGERILAVYHVDGKFYALDGICPHAGGPLGEGTLQGNIVTCPWHGWQFDVTSGQHCLNDHLKHPCFPVTVDGGEVFVELG
ncbi:Ferredoxin CarAc [Symmachiella dynata]|uniref:Rieske (2Fe-2S) protein n=1 Tax=Symmachiella dynata TaxID=2527995 RepID=UPI00118C3A7B|nr:Rieske 2Fe-2S domain-containing protein [Symmachiella dynata]QDT47659.1 Ferredoxin CarAc [Symmachiella dynata]